LRGGKRKGKRRGESEADPSLSFLSTFCGGKKASFPGKKKEKKEKKEGEKKQRRYAPTSRFLSTYHSTSRRGR